jgi:hypothetical protein
MVVVAGQYEIQGSIVVQGSKTGAGIAKGDILDVSGGQWRTAPAGTGAGPYAVATKAAASSDPTVQVLLQGIVYLTADSSITPKGNIIISATTAGRVIAGAGAYGTLVGKYLAHENEGDGFTVETNASAAEVVRCFFNPVV